MVANYRRILLSQRRAGYPLSQYRLRSMRSILFRIGEEPEGNVSEAEEWLGLEGTPIEYGEGFNLNGIAATGDERYLITVQSKTGKLYRVDTESKEVIQ